MRIGEPVTKYSLAGRTAVVTGASRGIGRAIAVSLAREGASVTLVARNAELLAEVKAEIDALGGTSQVIVMDLSTEDAAEKLSQELDFDSLNILVNNAGGNSFMSSTEKMRL